MRAIADVAPLRQYQLVQKEFDPMEVRLVTAAPLTAEQEHGLRQHILSRLSPDLRLKFVYCESIPRSVSGKFEDFISEVAVART